MKKKPVLTSLGETEMEILRHVWDAGRASVAEVHARILSGRPLAYTTVMTVMKKLADKGYLKFEQEGSAYVYSAARPEGEVKRTVLTGILEKVFGGSPVDLVETLVRSERLSEAEREEIRKIIEELGAGPDKREEEP